MFIQCQNCNATYKIDEDKIPDQETFVRCSKCSTPISLNKQEQSDLSRKQPHKIVDCDNCGTRYSIPLEKIGDGVMPVRCGKCGNVFDVSADETDDTMFDSPANPDLEDDLSMNNINIPEENEIEVNGLFDEVEEEEEEDAFDNSDELNAFDDFADPDLEDDEFNDEPKGPTEAYLESVDLSSQREDELDEDSELDDISSDEQYDLFLKPNPVDKSEDASAKQLDPESDRWPDIHDETGSLDTDLEDFVELDDLGEMPDSADFDADNPLELQEMSIKKRPNRIAIVVLLVLLAVLLGAAAWFYFQPPPTQKGTPPPIEAYSKQSRLKLLEPLKGRFTTNKVSGEKIFMLEGEIRNDYPAGTIINWVEVKGILFDKNNTALSESTTYAGKILTAKTLQQATLAELKTIRDAKTDEMNLELDNQQSVPFQILFFDAGNNIQKLQAQISRFSRKQSR